LLLRIAPRLEAAVASRGGAFGARTARRVETRWAPPDAR